MDYVRTIAEEHPYLLPFFDAIGDALYFCDAKGNLIYINEAAEKLDGYTNDDIYGRHVHDAYGLDESTSPLLRALTTDQPVVDVMFRYYVNGREICQICNARPMHNKGQVIGAYTIQRDVTNLKEIIEKNIALQKRLFSNAELGERDRSVFDRILGEHTRFAECKRLAHLASKSDSTVLLVGDTGTGKELFARCIHDASARRDGPFIAINCAAIPESLLESLLFGTSKGIYTGAVEREGLFEQANGGTLFLDEINSMPLVCQTKLLRVLEDKFVQHLGSKDRIAFDARIISSCNKPPHEAIRERQIREDLFYRLAVINIMIPTLKERKSDVFLLANHFITKYNEAFGKHVMEMDPDVLAFFLDFDWPGNVRQLKHCIESAMNFVSEEEFVIRSAHLPHYLVQEDAVKAGGYRKKTEKPLAPPPAAADDDAGKQNVFESIQERERNAIVAALIDHNGKVAQAAKALGLTRQAMIYRMKKHNIK